ncbi:hypothetical protein [Halorhabdus sp. CUG00001]|uniref:DUF7319 domain-containing protein n=1 Tax=Halorhabdus sp. CUG00001 TaxID=2600297 RepID=UPI001E533595|nr:hypothetical protein [Halorhabdus sp. CUG00001]
MTPAESADDEHGGDERPVGDGTAENGAGSDAAEGDKTATGAGDDGDPSLAELREQVEDEYDFDSFGPAEMADMEPEEWEAAFDPDTWITGEKLLERLEADLRQRVADRDVFARIEREEKRLVAYSDESYAIVHPDGTVEGEGTVLRDVKPSVALCSMDSYEVPTPPDGELLPAPEDVREGDGELGNIVVQLLAMAQLLAALALLGFGVTGGNAIAFVAGLGFLVIGLLLLAVVANARLSDAFRAEQYRDRLRAMGEASDERPAFVPDSGETVPDRPSGAAGGEQAADDA